MTLYVYAGWCRQCRSESTTQYYISFASSSGLLICKFSFVALVTSLNFRTYRFNVRIYRTGRGRLTCSSLAFPNSPHNLVYIYYKGRSLSDDLFICDLCVFYLFSKNICISISNAAFDFINPLGSDFYQGCVSQDRF